MEVINRFILFLIVGLVFISGCIQQKSDQGTTTHTTTAAGITTTTRPHGNFSGLPPLPPLLNMTVLLDRCEKTNESFRDMCYMSAAGITKNSSICEKMINETNRDRCYMNIVGAGGDTSICESIINGTFRDRCYTSAARLTKDSSICEKIQNSQDKQMCTQLTKTT
jgi:hypothetical protein